jgi:hypothetical protein
VVVEWDPTVGAQGEELDRKRNARHALLRELQSDLRRIEGVELRDFAP